METRTQGTNTGRSKRNNCAIERHTGGASRGNGSTYDPAIHHRRSIRLRGHNYAGYGVYFVTLCVAERRPLFGTDSACRTPTHWPKRPACVVSGFLSPMERAVFDDCLNAGIPIVWIMARGLLERFPPRIHRALDTGRLLAMTPFDASIDGFSAARAAWCNQYALETAAHAVIGSLTPDGMLACLLADLRRDIPVHYLSDPHPRPAI